MKKRILAVLLAAVMVTSMVACGNNDSGNNTGDTGNNTNTGDTGNDTPDTTPDDGGDQDAPEEPAYDFGGAVIRVSKGPFDDLKDSNEGNASYITAWDAARQVEEKYNIKFEYAELEGQSGYNDTQNVLQGINNGEAFADIFCFANNVMMGLKDYLTDITADVDELQIGSLFTEAGSWNGHTYGWTFDNLGSVDVLVYSRDYLKKIGMDVTPTEKFLAGEWSYPEALEYFTELQSKLPTGTYCISVYPNHWAWLSSAPNGIMPVSIDGTINLTDERYISAMNFYHEMLDAGVAAPITDVTVDENGTIDDFNMPYNVNGDICTKDEDKQIVLAVAEAWQMEGLYDSLGEWGIVPFPWDPEYTTATGDYTTLSDTYMVSQRYWTNILVPQADYRSADAAAIPDIILHKIALDYLDFRQPNRSVVRHEMWEAEQAGEAYDYWGENPGTMGNFTTAEDAGLYDWLHTRVALNHGYSVSSYVSTVMVGYQGICVGDPRAAAESYAAAGEAALVEAGLK